MRPTIPRPLAILLAASIGLAACSGSDDTITGTAPESLQLTADQVASLDSSAQQTARANPTNSDLRSLTDSVLMVLTAGIQAKRLTIATDLTSAPLYAVGIHRAVTRAQGGYSTWTVVAMDDFTRLNNLVEVSGFAQSSSNAPPSSVTGTIGDGTGIGNAFLLQVGTNAAVTEWRGATGSVSFASDAAGAACPGFVPAAGVACALETMHVHFGVAASSGTGGAGGRQATLGTDVEVPTMRLTYTR
jgi:hypothetical protein